MGQPKQRSQTQNRGTDTSTGGGKAGTPARFPDELPVSGRVPAWVMSLGLHVALVLCLAIWWERQPRGTGAEPDRPVGIAVAHRMADRTQYEAVSEQTETDQQTTDPSESSSAAAAAAAAAAEVAQPIDVDGLLADITDIPMADAGVGTGTALEANEGNGLGAASVGDGDGPEASTMFFGVSGSGRRFVYVLDRSDSMEGTPLNAAKSEMVRSLRALGAGQSFQVVIYNNRSKFFQPQGQSFWMLPADESMLRRAERFIRATTALGGTEHYDALKMALKLEPDVIFFLTDARIPRLRRSQLNEIHVLCQRAGTTIHAVEFGRDLSAPDDSFLRELAGENLGEYRYINVATLQATP